jgi:hypothetical protein
MRSLSRWTVSLLAASLWSCTPETTGGSGSSVACYQTATGLTCRPTSEVDGLPLDVDDDGEEDAFYCGDTDVESGDESGSESDLGAPRTGGGDDDDDSESSDDGSGCAGADSESESASDSDSMVDSEDSEGDDSESDADQDGVVDGLDCDCLPPGEEVPPPTPPDGTPIP